MKRCILFTLCLTLFFGCKNNPVEPKDPYQYPPITARDPLFEPTIDKKLLIMGQDLDAVGGMPEKYTEGYMDDNTLPVPSGFTTYTSLTSRSSNRGLTTVLNDGAGEKCADSLVNHPNASFNEGKPIIAIGLYMVGSEQAIADGKLDSKIEDLGDWIKGSGAPVLLRIGYEFDGDWNHYIARYYKIAFRRIASKFEEMGVKNCAYVWQSDGFNDGPNNLSWYPGDEYVDWIGYSHFTANGAWMVQFAREKGKPVLISEATPNYHDLVKQNSVDEWNAWFKPLFNYINQNKDVIKGLCYINQQWYTQPMWKTNEYFNTCDSRIQYASDASLKANWINEMKTNNWFEGSEALKYLRGWN